jgi:hypothetical protein
MSMKKTLFSTENVRIFVNDKIQFNSDLQKLINND